MAGPNPSSLELERTGGSDLAIACGAFAMACSCLVLAGWATDLSDLKVLFIQGAPVVPPLSALALGVLGLALSLYGGGNWLRTAQGAALAVLAFGAFSIASHLFEFRSELFLVLFPDSVQRDLPSHMGRPAPQTAFSLCALGLGLLTAVGKQRGMHTLSQAALAVAFAGAWTTLFSFTINASEIYRLPWHPASGMSIFAAAMVLVLAVGAYSLRTDAGIGMLLVSTQFGGRSSRLLLMVALFAPLGLGLALRSSDREGVLPTEATTWAVAIYCLLIAAVAIRMSWLSGVHETRQNEAQREREELIAQLKQSLEENRRLESEMVRICAWTKMIEDQGRWIPFEQFLTERLHLQVTNAISPEGLERIKREGITQPDR